MERVRPRESKGLLNRKSKKRHHSDIWVIRLVLFPRHHEETTLSSFFFSMGYYLLGTLDPMGSRVCPFEQYWILSFSLSLETTELGSKKELKSMPFITYLSGLLTAQMLSDDQLISGVEIRCEEKGRCPSTCHLCRRPGKEQLSPTPVLLEINRVVPLYTLIQDNGTKEVSSPDTATNSHLSTSLPPSCPSGPFVHWDGLSSPSWWWLTFIDPLPYFKYIYSCYNQ